MTRLIPVILAALTFSASGAPLAIVDLKRDTPVDFAKEIHPLLKRSCLACHNTTKAKAGLNLESPQAILKGGDGGPAATPGKGNESLVLRSASHQEESAMPPPGNKVNAPDLTPDELGLLKLWIDQGLKGSAVADQVATWRGYPAQHAPVAAAALSSTGRIAAAARGNQVHLTEVATGLSLGQLSDPELQKLDLYQGRAVADRDAVMAVAFGSDDLLATGGYRTVRLWRRAPLTEQGAPLPLPAAVTSFTSTATQAAAGSADGNIRIWDPAAEQPSLKEFKEHATAIKALCFSPDGQFLVSTAADRTVRVWDVASGTPVFRTESPGEITALCFLKGGTELAAAFADGMLRLYPFTKEAPAAAPAALREWKLGDQAATALSTPDPAGTQLLWTNQEPVLHLTDSADGKRVADVALENPAQAAITRAEGHLKAAQRHLEGRKARLATATEAVKKESENLRTTHQGQEKARADWQRKLGLARTADSALRVVPGDKGRQDAATKASGEASTAERAFTDARTNAELAVRLTGQAMQLQAASEGSASAVETTVAENTATLESLKKALVPVSPPQSLTLLDGGKVALIALDNGRLQWHSLATGELLDAAESSAPGLTLLTTANNQILAARADQKVVRLPSRRPFVMDRLIGKPDDAATLTNRVTALSFSSDARLLATGGGVASRSGEVKIWNTTDGTLVLDLPDPHSDTVNALAFSPDDSLIATAGSDRWARVFQVTDGRRTTSLEGHSGQVLSIAWRSDGLALATGGADKTLRFWDLLDGKQTRSLTSFTKEVSAVSWLGTGDTVASASGDAAVRLNEEALPGAKSFCFALASDPSGSLVAAGGEDGVLRIWQTASKKLLREVP